MVAVIGPSGSGKSTFLRCLNLLETPTEGKIFVDDEQINAPKVDGNRIRQKMGMVFQQFNLWPHKTVLENVMECPVQVKKANKEETKKKAMELLARVGMDGKADAYPTQLSGGQQQRVSIARALALKPQILFFDEPTSALDPELTGEILKVIKELAKEKMTMVIVTHEMAFARDVANHVIFMDDGYIVEEGTPEEVFGQTQNERTKQFLQRFNDR